MKLLAKLLTGMIVFFAIIGIGIYVLVQQFENSRNEANTSEQEYVEETKSVEEFIGSISETARTLAAENDLYASVMIAQATLESQYGQSGLGSSPNNNLFGIKGKYKNDSVKLETSEDDGKGNMTTVMADFRKYPSYEESLEDYVRLLRNGLSWNKKFYTGVFKSNTKSFKDATKHLTGSYATDSKYNKKLNKLIAEYDLTQYDKPVKNKTTIKVGDGDSLNHIAETYNVKVTSIKQWNKLNTETIEAGQKLEIFQY
ncbi:glucosaminidase domain-containing protein [Viridibacillus sp. FSL R5-0477]|uniref:Peptidoglycan hydrolase n=1 Tax=Viridibacillus arenosi FSL R5-213 TaxID=1227360 RepID=W4EJS7_9BACL|nr:MULTISPECIES: glucosaminidase domain-containing protein [Viridibacillus]ETT80853.1 autolysin [Viridibacillus arenosi FSL R5-213]OMC78414.1 autolysin [Viridibacillus sp. FSL H8-0123]OMC81905.1 autolysin [Viridibacillus sp. FSL H7-0596]OMC92980.1 autolysin [Viridibacillus arenosi]